MADEATTPPADAPADDQDNSQDNTPDEPTQAKPQTLDEALDQAEGELDEGKADTDDGDDSGKEDESEDGTESEEKTDETKEGDKAADTPDKPETEEEETEDSEEEAPGTPEATEEVDITKPGEGKVAMKTYDGKTIYVTKLEDIPDDVDAANPKEWIRVSQELQKLENQRNYKAAEAEATRTREAETKAIRDVQENWSNEIKSLTEGGRLGTPPGKKDEDNPDHPYNQKVEAVFQILQESTKPESKYLIQSFEQGLDLYEARELQKQRAEEEKARNAEKSRRGGLVQPSTSGATTAKAPVIPHGVSLDDVMEAELQNS